MTDAYFECNLIHADSSIVADTLIDVLNNLNTCYRQGSLRTLIINTRPSFEYFHPRVNFSVASAFIAILNYNSSVNFTSFYTL